MEFGNVLRLDGLVDSSSQSNVFEAVENEPVSQKRSFGSSSFSSSLKYERSNEIEEQQEDYWSNSLKVARSSSQSLFPDGGEQMLSFSSSKPSAFMISNDGSLPSYYQQHYYNPSYSSSSSFSLSPSRAACFYRNAGMVQGSTNVNMHGVMNRGPFTPSQWMELEHQAVIFKYIQAKAPVPSHFLIPLRRNINPTGLSTYPQGSFRSNAYGWGSFHLGFSGSSDPEPGRCRRTDGKKWRCSRDAVADQKYCERHLNRGRHRSRKLVEGHSGQGSKAVPTIAPTSQSPSVGSGGAAPKSLQSDVMDPSTSQFKRVLISKENTNDCIRDSQGPSMLNASSSKSLNPFEADFGLAPANALINHSRTFDSFDAKSQTHPLRHFIDEWPKTQSDEITQLSISIPTDFASSPYSPKQDKLALSPLRLSREFNSINEGNKKEASWVPISCEPSVGGPLGEVLTNTNCCTSSLNLLTGGWDLGPGLDTSPTGVLQKTTFGSVSSSTGSSPRAYNNKTYDNNGNVCGDLLGATLAKPSTIPLL